jgi:AraC family transcriptional regulator
MFPHFNSVSDKFACPGLTFEETRHGLPFRMPRHSHDEAHLVLLFDGGIESSSNNRTSTVSRADLLFVPAGETHTSIYQGSVHAFYLQFRASWWEQYAYKDLPSLQETCEYRNTPPVHLAAHLHREFQQRDDLTPLMLEGLTQELLVTMARQSRGSEGSIAPLWLLRARDYLHAHFTENLTIDVVASAAGVHPGHLMRRFREQYHCTIGDYVRHLRVEKACQLLAQADTDMSLAEIALSLGFADQSHFSRTIKRATGKTPTELRNLSSR